MGAEAKIKAEVSKTFLLPSMSESIPAGKLMMIPGTVEAAATTPMRAVGVSRLSAKGFSTGFFDIVELRMAKAPRTHSVTKNEIPRFSTNGDHRSCEWRSL